MSHEARGAASFGGWLLPERPAINVVLPGHPAPAACPGSLAEPQATPGNLCLYVEDFSTVETFIVRDPSSGQPNQVSYDTGTGGAQTGDGRAGRMGFTFGVAVAFSTGVNVYGTWAVTG